jgi:hypothetical protein
MCPGSSFIVPLVLTWPPASRRKGLLFYLITMKAEKKSFQLPPWAPEATDKGPLFVEDLVALLLRASGFNQWSAASRKKTTSLLHISAKRSSRHLPT